MLCRWAAILLMPVSLLAADPLLALPTMPRPAPVAETVALTGEELAPGLRMARGQRVEIQGTILLDRGPVDGLEVFACLQGGKTHEAMIQVSLAQGALVKAAVIAAFGWSDGRPAREGSGFPTQGTPVRLRVAWTDPAGQEQVIDASSLVRDRITDQAYPALAWVWIGSRFETIRQSGADGVVMTRDQFMLEVTRSLIVNYDEPDALIGSPFPGAGVDQRFEVNSRICPPAKTPVRLLIEPAVLPLTLDRLADGRLAQDGRALNDEELRQLLVAAYGPATVLRSVGVRSHADLTAQHDAAAREYLLAQAALANVWAIPIFLDPR